MKSLEFFWETVSLLCRAFPKDTEKKGLQDNRYLHGLPVLFGTKLFQYRFTE